MITECKRFTEALKNDLISGPEDARRYSRLPLTSLAIPPRALSPENSIWLHCVEATKDKVGKHTYMIRIRVITNTHRGVNITINCHTKEMYEKYLDLRFQVRNSDYVLVTFPDIFVITSRHTNRELYLYTNDFFIYNPSSNNSCADSDTDSLDDLHI